MNSSIVIRRLRSADRLPRIFANTDFDNFKILKPLLLFLRARVQPIWTHTLRPFYSRPIALNQEKRSQVDDVCECVRD